MRRKTRWLAFSIIVGLMTCAVQARERAVTLEQVTSAPIPSGLTAAHDGGRIAWVYNIRGRRNVWIAEPGARGYIARQITSYSVDDGYDLGELVWDPRGETVVYTRGSTLQIGSHQTFPVTNPLGLPQGGTPLEIWAISSAPGASPRKLAEGRNAAVSPDGDWVAFVNGGQVWLASLSGHAPPRQLIHDNGDSDGHFFSAPPPLVWSPDGTRLAFVSQRGDHSFIGVYDFAGNTVTWVAPSVDVDSKPVWSKDSSRIAFVRVPAGGGVFAAGPRVPWSIWIADAATGRGRELWRADPGAGMAFHSLDSMQEASPLLWAACDRIIFPWEKTGWVHLYSISTSGGAALPLTPGDFEVFAATLTPDGHEVIYSANKDDLERSHLWRVAVTGGTAVQLTRGNDSEDTPVVLSTAGNTIAAVQGGGASPLQPGLVLANGSMRVFAHDAVPREYPRSGLLGPQSVTFQSTDGLILHGQLFLPSASPRKKRYPALLFFHGGPNQQMLLTWTPSEAHNYANCLYLAAQGYVVLSVNFRGSTGYGLHFREPENFSADGGSEVNDIRGAALYLRSRVDVDAKRIGIWGHSYGGVMTATGLANMSDLLAAGVAHAGVYDWRSILIQVGALQRGDPRGDAMYAASPIAGIKQWRSPVLVIQSDDDRNVPFSQFSELVGALREQGVNFEQLVIPNEIHEPLLHKSWLDVFHATAEFFSRQFHPERDLP